MSAAELREAASRERADWGSEYDQRAYPDASRIHLALADWLDTTADDCGTSSLTFHAGLAVARAINGGAS